MGFTKLDEGILRSSIMAEPSDVFKTWIAFLASCGPNGIANVSAVFISSVCRLSLEVVHEAIARLEAPDPESRTDTEEGRRIRRVNGGWFIVNYEKYRAFAYSESPGAVRTRRWREKRKRHGDVTDVSVTSRSASASAEADSSSSSSPKQSLKISFSEEGGWGGVTEEMMKVWKEAYPACDIKAELAKMKAWLLADWPRRKKVKWGAFIVRWLSKEQDRGGTRKKPDADPDKWLKYHRAKKKEGE